jgi:hypothetical protein
LLPLALVSPFDRRVSGHSLPRAKSTAIIATSTTIVTFVQYRVTDC